MVAKAVEASLTAAGPTPRVLCPLVYLWSVTEYPHSCGAARRLSRDCFCRARECRQQRHWQYHIGPCRPLTRHGHKTASHVSLALLAISAALCALTPLTGFKARMRYENLFACRALKSVTYLAYC